MYKNCIRKCINLCLSTFVLKRILNVHVFIISNNRNCFEDSIFIWHGSSCVWWWCCLSWPSIPSAWCSPSCPQYLLKHGRPGDLIGSWGCSMGCGAHRQINFFRCILSPTLTLSLSGYEFPRVPSSQSLYRRVLVILIYRVSSQCEFLCFYNLQELCW